MKKDLIVISDLHVGAGALDDCDEALEGAIVNFFEYLGTLNNGVHLVINGDFLDFVQASPWKGAMLEAVTASGIPLCFTEIQSLEKLANIIGAHSSIFTALGGLLRVNRQNELTIIPGNHDADFFWQSVREKFIDEIANGNGDVSDRVEFYLEQVFRPREFPGVWIEHGHQYDPLNCFQLDGRPFWSTSVPPIFKAEDGTPRLYECIGSRFMIRFLNGIDEFYPFVDNVKPFSKFLKLFAMSALAPGFGSMQVAVSVWAMIKYIRNNMQGGAGDLLSIEDGDKEIAEQIIKWWTQSLSNDDRSILIARLEKNGFSFNGASWALAIEDNNFCTELLDFLGEKQLYLGDLKIESLQGMLSLGKGFYIDEADELLKRARRILKLEGVKLVVMGHTHEPQIYPDRISYINTGCWTRFLKPDSKNPLRGWDILTAHGHRLFPFELNYVQISKNEDYCQSFRTFNPNVAT
jgi:UDP-2,3-diacylglucosamine pyrophosphatase LpxH